MSKPFVRDHLQDGELACCEACRQMRRQWPCRRVFAPPQKRSPPVWGSLLRGSLDEVARHGDIGLRENPIYRPTPALDRFRELLRLIIGNAARTVGAPDLAGVVIELASSGVINRRRKLVKEHRSLPHG